MSLSVTLTGLNPSLSVTLCGPNASLSVDACKTAVDRANSMLAVAVELQRTLAEYGRVVNDPANDGLSSRELRDKTAPALQTGASASARLDRALADYRQVVDRCKLSTP